MKHLFTLALGAGVLAFLLFCSRLVFTDHKPLAAPPAQPQPLLPVSPVPDDGVVQPVVPSPVTKRQYTLYLYTTSGCVACTRLKGELNDPLVQTELANFKVIEVRNNHPAARARGVTAYPTLIVTSCCQGAEEKEEGRRVGYLPAHSLAGWLKSFPTKE